MFAVIACRLAEFACLVVRRATASFFGSCVAHGEVYVLFISLPPLLLLFRAEQASDRGSSASFIDNCCELTCDRCFDWQIRPVIGAR